MKKIKQNTMLLLSALLFSAAALQAQSNAIEDGARRFRAGFVAGFNASQLDGDDMKGYDRMGLHLGLQSTYPLDERLGLGVEILYSMKGSNESLDLSSSNNSLLTKIRMDYMEVPIWVRYREWKFDFRAGLAYARLIRAETTTATTSYEAEDFKSNDFSLFVGAAYRIDTNWALALRWGRSLTNAIKSGIPKDGLNGHWLTFRLEYLL